MLVLVSWATARVGVHRLSLQLPYLGDFSMYSSSLAIRFLLYDRLICVHLVDPSLTRLLGEFLCLGLALVPNVVVPGAQQGCIWSIHLDPNICLGRLRTSDLGSFVALKQ